MSSESSGKSAKVKRADSPAAQSTAAVATSAGVVKEVRAERNRQAQRRYRQRQKEKIEELQARLNAEQSENAGVIGRLESLVAAVELRKEELRQLRTRQAVDAGLEEEAMLRKFTGDVTLTFRADRTVMLTPQQIQGMTEMDLARIWALYVKELAVLLLAVEAGDAPADVLARIKALVQHELLVLHFQAALTNMASVNQLVATAVVEKVRVALGCEGPALWRRVADAMQLTHAQREDVVQLWRSFREKLARLAPARAEIHARIAAALPTGTMAGDFAVQFLAAHEGMVALERNLRSEHVLIHGFLSHFCTQGFTYAQTLTVVQMARCVVRSFPYYPDIPAIVLWLAPGDKNSGPGPGLH